MQTQGEEPPGIITVVGDLLGADLLNKTVACSDAVYNVAALVDLEQASHQTTENIRTQHPWKWPDTRSLSLKWRQKIHLRRQSMFTVEKVASTVVASSPPSNLLRNTSLSIT